LLVLLAMIFVGKGITALQEAGTLPVDPVNFPSIPALGLYPNLLRGRGIFTQPLIEA
jgi:high-affinity iron transporter